jgi:membrane-associated phospholipid phosphatase
VLFLIPISHLVPFLECWNLTFLNDRLRQWLSATLLAGLLVMATAGALFMYLADEIGEQARLTQVDLAVAQFFHNHGTPWAVRLFEAITFFGNPSTLGVIGLVTALVLAFHRRWSLLLGWAFALIGAGELNVILKGIFRRLRPQLPDPWVTPSGWSFPSGHAMGSFVTYGFLAYLLTRVPGADFPRRTAVAVLAVLVLLIGFSRIYLGAHYLSDVIAGYAAAAVWLTFCILVTDRTQRRWNICRARSHDASDVIPLGLAGKAGNTGGGCAPSPAPHELVRKAML